MNRLLHKKLCVISDLHVSAGQPGLDDFQWDGVLQRLLEQELPRQAQGLATLVIAGDFIDFPQILPKLGRHDLGVQYGSLEEESVQKLNAALAVHEPLTKALAAFLAKGNQVLVLPGNHDIDLHWPRVFDQLRQELGGVGEPQFAFVKQGCLTEAGVYIEHGNQYTPDNVFRRWTDPFLDARDGRRLERPFGTLLLDLVQNEVQVQIPHANKVYPHWLLAKLALQALFVGVAIDRELLWKVARFFLQEGRGCLMRQFLGARPVSRPADDVDNLLKAMGLVPGVAMDALRADLLRRLGSAADTGPRMLGALGLSSTDPARLHQRARTLLNEGRHKLVVFGHTHDEIDGNVELICGTRSSRRYFNTGSWVPKIIPRAGETLTWGNLAEQPQAPALRFLFVDVTQAPIASLVTLDYHASA